MAKRKTVKKNIRKKNKKRPAGGENYLIKVCVGFSILILLVVTAGVLMHHFMVRQQPRPVPLPVEKTPPKKIPTYEIYPKEKSIPPKPVPELKPIPIETLPKIAIIIDDIGYDTDMAKKFLKLDSSLTFSVLPYSPFSKKIAEIARTRGCETMLHLPMEPNEYPAIDPGPGALLTAMSPDELIEQLKADLNSIPNIKGVNNHMGSRMTSSSTQMYQIFSILKKRGLYFIDSKTTPDSICRPSARLLQVPFAERDVFIDHVQDPDFIRKQIELLIRIAEKYGTSIGIAHPHEQTYQVLRDILPEIKKRVTIVPASNLVDQIG